jgi:amino acid permease
MSEEEGSGLSGPMTVIAMVNGMIGGLILILPVMALESGWLLTLIVLLVTGFISYYSCYLCVLHTGDASDMDIAMEQHFWNSRKIKMFYEFCIFSTIIVILILYYELIVIQWEGLACNNEYTPLNPVINAFALLAMVFVIKFKDFGASLMAYGIVSIVAYLFFITWAVGSEDSGHDHERLRLFHGDGIELAAALGQAFAIQAFFIPVLKQNRKPHKYKLYTLMAFVLGTLAYGYIALMGSQGIVHRQFLGDEGESRTIEGYFEAGAWQVKAIEVIYLVHLYSVFPEFLLISK